MHTLNGTAVTARALLAVLENHQQEDGTVRMPAGARRGWCTGRAPCERLERLERPVYARARVPT